MRPSAGAWGLPVAAGRVLSRAVATLLLVATPAFAQPSNPGAADPTAKLAAGQAVAWEDIEGRSFFAVVTPATAYSGSFYQQDVVFAPIATGPVRIKVSGRMIDFICEIINGDQFRRTLKFDTRCSDTSAVVTGDFSRMTIRIQHHRSGDFGEHTILEARHADAYLGWRSSAMVPNSTAFFKAMQPQLAGSFYAQPQEQKPSPASSAGSAPAPERRGTAAIGAPPASVPGTRIRMDADSGTFRVPVRVNDVIELKFTLDSGASDVSIPTDVVLTLIRTGTLTEKDFKGTQRYRLADGSVIMSRTFKLRSLKVGDRVMTDVDASVAEIQGSLLLGQSFLRRFRSWSIDNLTHELVLD